MQLDIAQKTDESLKICKRPCNSGFNWVTCWCYCKQEVKRNILQLITNRTRKRAARLRLWRAISTDTVTHDEQPRGWRRPTWTAPSLTACGSASEEGLFWTISREHKANGAACGECLGQHEQNAHVVLLWGGITDHPRAPGAALALCSPLTQVYFCKRISELGYCKYPLLWWLWFSSFTLWYFILFG